MKLIAVQVFEAPVNAEYDLKVSTAEDQAKLAFKEVEKAAKDGKIKVESATVVVREQDGAKLRRTSEWTSGRGARWGGFWGLLVGIIFAGPIGGLLAGIGLGAILGGKATKGIDRKFMKELSQSMRPGRAAVFMLLPEEDEKTIKFLEAYEGPLHLTPLTDDVKEAIDNASTREDVLEAISFDEDE